MATEAPSAVNGRESPRSVVDAVAAHLAQVAPPPGDPVIHNGRNGAASPPGPAGNGDAPPGHDRRDAGAGAPARETAEGAGAGAGTDADGPADDARAEGAVRVDGADEADGAGRPASGDDHLTGTGDGAADPADPAHFAAAAVLDVLRASGWADTVDAGRLRAEVERLRELLDLVVRDHRAREASAAGVENQQLYWLVPLLRAAHGVAFGSLGAKVSLRTAMQEVPADVLASAGLRIDYGVEHAGLQVDQEH